MTESPRAPTVCRDSAGETVLYRPVHICKAQLTEGATAAELAHVAPSRKEETASSGRRTVIGLDKLHETHPGYRRVYTPYKPLASQGSVLETEASFHTAPSEPMSEPEAPKSPAAEPNAVLVEAPNLGASPQASGRVASGSMPCVPEDRRLSGDSSSTPNIAASPFSQAARGSSPSALARREARSAEQPPSPAAHRVQLFHISCLTYKCRRGTGMPPPCNPIPDQPCPYSLAIFTCMRITCIAATLPPSRLCTCK